jgi:hypothetical protein
MSVVGTADDTESRGRAMVTTEEENVVYVSKEPVDGATPALAEPRFVIEMEGKYYLTLAVWEYDKEVAAESKDETLIAGCRDISESFDKSTHPLAAAPATATLYRMGATGPRPSR